MAEPLARRAVELDGSAWQDYFELARALYGLERFGEAEQNAAVAARLNFDNPQTFLLLANIYARQQKYREVSGALDRYLHLAPDGDQADQARQMQSEVRAILDSARLGVSPPASGE
jgi:hypothetical protein